MAAIKLHFLAFFVIHRIIPTRLYCCTILKVAYNGIEEINTSLFYKNAGTVKTGVKQEHGCERVMKKGLNSSVFYGETMCSKWYGTNA